MPNVWTVVLGFNGLEDSRLCLRSLEAVDDGRPNVVYVDNASAADEAMKIAIEFPWCKVISNISNEGYAGGNNRGIEYALEHGAERILILNNDTVVSPDLIETMTRLSVANPDVGILGPVIGFMDEPDVVMTDGCRFNSKDGGEFFKRQEIQLDGPERLVDTDIVNGCCLMMTADAARAAGGAFDEAFFLVHEESEFCLRVKQAGLRVAVVNRMLVWHKGSSAFKRTGRRLQKYFGFRNLPMLLRKRRPFGGERRSALASRLAYWRHAYHIFWVEREDGQHSAADAVLEGIEDAMWSRTGAYVARRRPLVPPLRALFLLGRIVHGGTMATAASPR